MDFTETYSKYEEYFTLNFKQRSIDSAKSIFKLYIIPFFENRKMEEITKVDIIKFQNFIDKKTFKFKYKKDIYVMLAMFFRFANKYLDLENNVVSQVGFIIKNRDAAEEVAQVWSLTEYRKFSSHVDDTVFKYLFDFLFFTGARLGEVTALTFRDIENDTVSINRTTIKGNRGFNSPKTPSSRRKFKIDFKLKNEIKQLEKMYKKKYPNFSKDFFIFGGNTQLAYTTITRRKNEACKLAKVRQIRIHDFRHTHVSMLLSKKVNVKAICERVGHKDVATTLNIYTHVLNKDNHKLMKKINLLRILGF